MRIDQVQESKMLLDALKEAQSRLVPYIVTQALKADAHVKASRKLITLLDRTVILARRAGEALATLTITRMLGHVILPSSQQAGAITRLRHSGLATMGSVECRVISGQRCNLNHRRCALGIFRVTVLKG